MAKHVNKKMVAGLTFAGMVVLTIAAVGMLMLVPAKDPAKMAERAKDLFEKGNYLDAGKAYQKAMARAQDAERGKEAINEYALKAGEMYLLGGQAAPALKVWQSAVVKDPDNVEIQEHIIDLMLETRYHPSDIQEACEKLMAMPDQTENPIALNGLGIALAYQRQTDPSNLDKGIELLLRAIAIEPKNPEYAKTLVDFRQLKRQELVQKMRQAQNATELETLNKEYSELLSLLVEPYNNLLDEEHPEQRPETTIDLAKAYRYRGELYRELMSFFEQQYKSAYKSQQPEEVVQNFAARMVVCARAAEADFTKAIELTTKANNDPEIIEEHVKSLVGLGLYWENRPAIEKDEKVSDHRASALGLYKQAIDTDSETYDAYLLRAILLRKAGDLDDALTCLDSRITRGINKEHYLSYQFIIQMHLLREEAFSINYSICENNYNRLSFNRDDPELKNQLIAAWYSMNQLYKRTVAEFGASEDNPYALFMKARIDVADQLMRDSGITAVSKADLKNAGIAEDAVNSSVEDSLSPSGTMIDAIKKLEAANAQLGTENAGRMRILVANLKTTLARLKLLAKEPGPARTYLEEALKLYPNSPEALTLYCQALYQLREDQRAITVATEALANKDLNSGQAYSLLNILVQANERSGDMEKAQSWLEQRNKAFANVGKDLGTGARIQEAQLKITEARQTTPPDNLLLDEAEAILAEVIEAEPLNTNGVTQYFQLQYDRKSSEEMQALVDAHEARVQSVRAAAEEANDTATVKQADEMLGAIKGMRLAIDPDATNEQKRQHQLAIIEKLTDEFQKEVSLFDYYSSVPDETAKAEQHLTKAAGLAKLDATNNEAVFQRALRSGNDKIAKLVVDRAIDHNLDGTRGHFFQGQWLESQAEYSEALNEYQAALKDRGDFLLGHLSLGRVLMGITRFDEAEDAFQKASRLNPTAIQPIEYLTRLYSIQGQHDKVADLLIPIIRDKRNPNWLRAANYLYGNYLNQRPMNLVAARNLVEDCRKDSQQKGDPLWASRLSQIARLMSQPENCINYAKEAVQLAEQKPKYLASLPTYVGELLNSYLLSGSRDVAIQYAEDVAKKSGTDPRYKRHRQQYITNLLEVYLKAGRYDEVFAYIQKEWTEDQYTANIHLILAGAYAGKGDTENAVNESIAAHKAAKIDMPDELDAFSKLFASFVLTPDNVVAIRGILDQRIQSTPDNLAALHLKVTACFGQQDFATASAVVNDLLALTPATDKPSTEMRAYYLKQQSVIYHRNQDFENAYRCYDQVLEITPNDLLSLNNAAMLLIDNLNRPADALKYSKRAAELSPTSPAVIDTYGWNLTLANQLNEGIKQLRKAVPSAQEKNIAAICYHLAYALHKRGTAPDAGSSESDLAEAGKQVKAAAQILINVGRDDEHIANDVKALAKELGIELSGVLPDSSGN